MSISSNAWATNSVENSSANQASEIHTDLDIKSDKLNDTHNNATQSGDTQSSPTRNRVSEENKATDNKFAITPHKPNYILPLTYNLNPNDNIYEELNLEDASFGKLDRVEAKFQLSFKILLSRSFFLQDSKLWFAYTQLAYWQMYNADASSPFRETNYEPEIIWSTRTAFRISGFALRFINVAFNHQSNGRAKPLSRSWNRITANFILERENIVMSIKPWYRIPEDKQDDDNPDIEAYLGYADYSIIYKRNSHLASIRLRNNLRSENKSSIELAYTLDLNGRLKGIVQYFYGHGESLIDYNHRSHRIGIGVLLTDWL